MPRSQEGLARLIEREGIVDERVVAAFRAVDRADFIPEGSVRGAYADAPIPLPEGQTTSQPSLIARMIDAAAPAPSDRALEIGSGYGFQTALLAQLCREVVSIERSPVLAEAARRNLYKAGVQNAAVLVGDGWQGCAEKAPFDCMVVSAAASAVPAALADQLVEGGRLVIPVRREVSDDVILFEKKQGALLQKRLVTPARFVPLVKEEQQ